MYSASRRSVGVWFATLVDADLGLLRWLDERERARYQRYARDADRARFLMGAALFRAAAASRLGGSPGQLVVDRTCAECGRWHGAPRVPGSVVTGSVAHSGVVVIVAVASAGRVGIDVEHPGRSEPRKLAAWVRREARWKAGGGALRYRDLPAIVPGYVAGVAASVAAGSLDARPRAGGELLRRR